MFIVLLYFLVALHWINGQSQMIVYDLPQTRNASDLCAMQMEVFVSALTSQSIWALSMLDASSKIPTGIMVGNLNDLGNFDQCVAIEHQTENLMIKGKHCLGALSIPLTAILPVSGLHLSLSLCIPDACTPTEVSQYLSIESIVLNDQQCQTNERLDLDAADIAVTTFLSVILLIMIVSSVYDVYINRRNLSPAHPMLLAFSVVTNGKKLLAVNNNNVRELGSLHGLRCISMIWVVAGHRYAGYLVMPITNALDIQEFLTRLYSQYIQSAHVAVDTFFFLSGMMISYGYFKTVKKPKGLSFVPLYYLHRYLRLTPALAVVFMFTLTVWRHFGSGPMWPIFVNNVRNPCLTWWWSYFLYVQNYVNNDEVCIGPTWYLSADMQLYFLAPLIFLPLGYITLRKSKKIVYCACVSLVILFMVIQAVVRHHIESDNNHMTHERLAVWMVGFTVGILLEDIKSTHREIKMNPLLNLLTWAVVLTGMISILLTMHDVTQNQGRVEMNMFNTFQRPAWALGLSWIIFSCTIGYGGFVNWFLSLPTFQVLSRLTYCMYLVHFLPLFLNSAQIRTAWHFTELNVFYNFCGDLILTLVFALVWVLAFESPMIIIAKCIFEKNRSTKKNDDLTVDKRGNVKTLP